MEKPTKIAICAIVTVLLVACILIPVIDSTEQEITHVDRNTGDAGIPLAKYTDTSRPNDVLSCDVSFSIDNETTGPVLRTTCAGFSSYSNVTAPVNQIVFQSEHFSVFVKDGALYCADFTNSVCKPFENGTIITVIITPEAGIYVSIPEFGQYDTLDYLFIPQIDGEYASFRAFQYENSDPIAESCWAYDDFVFVLASNGTDFISEGFGLTVEYINGMPGNGIIYKR